MGTVFMAVMRMSMVGSVTILAVCLLRALIGRAPKIFSYMLWIVVLFRLLCPVSVQSGFSFFGVGRQAAEFLYFEREGKEISIDGMEGGGNKDAAGVPVFAYADGGNAGLDFTNQKTFSHKKTGGKKRLAGLEKIWNSNTKKGLSVVWLAGLLGLCGFTFAKEYRLKRYLDNAVRWKENIYIREGLDTPFVMGVFVPKIYLPKGLGGQELEYILLHEQIHIKRFDPLFRRMAFAALAIHWFNPLVWLAFFLSGRDMEMSCDEAVLRHLGNEVKKDYSNSLLSMAAGKNIGTLPLAFGEGDTGKRIVNVLKYHRIKTGAAVMCAGILLAALAVLATNPKERKEVDAAVENSEVPDSEILNSEILNSEILNSEILNSETENDKIHAEIEGRQRGIDLPEQESRNREGVDGNTLLHVVVRVKSVSRSARTIDRIDGVLVLDDEPHKSGDMDAAETEKKMQEQIQGDGLVFAEECKYYINYNNEEWNPQHVDFEKFAACFEGEQEDVVQPCEVEFYDGLVQKIILLDYRGKNGVTYAQGEDAAYDLYGYLMSFWGNDFLEKYYTLKDTVYQDVADGNNEKEIIEIYIASSDKVPEGGLVIFKDAEGHIFHAEEASLSNAGNQNIYLGREDGAGQGFFMTLHMEDRDTYGVYEYHVYRFDRERKIYQLAGSAFEWGVGQVAVEDGLEIWSHCMEHYLKDSVLLLGTEKGSVRTEVMNNDM